MGISSYYFKNIGGKLIKHNYWDAHITSDDQGCKVDYAITCIDGSNHDIVTDNLVLWFDTNQSGTTTDGSSLISLVEWSGTTIKPSSGFTLCDFGLTGVDNGRYDQLSGISVTITSADTRVVLYPVTGYTIQEITTSACTSATTSIISGITATTCVSYTSSTSYVTSKGKYDYPWTFRGSGTTIGGCDVGSTICLDGGFYQGYFKLDLLEPTPEIESVTSTTCTTQVTTTIVEGDSDAMIYDLMPTEFENGWSMETWVKWENSYCSSGSTGTTLNDDFTGNTGFFFYIGTRAENKFRNVFSGETGLTTCGGIPIPPDVPLTIDTGGQSWFLKNNNRMPSCWCPCGSNIATGSTSGTTAYCDEISENALGFRVTPNGNIGYRKMTVSVGCYNNEERMTGTTMEEGYSETPIMYSGGSWNHVVVTWTQNSVKHGLLAGTLRFWVNGRVVYRVEEFIGLQLRALNEWSDKQLGVPFNISWGGGAQGLLESQTFGGPDPADDGLSLETNFAGTFEGELSQLRFYEKPLNILEVRNNMYVDCDRYCVRETYGGAQIVQPTSPFCENCN